MSGRPKSELRAGSSAEARTLAARFEEFRKRALVHAFSYRGRSYVLDPVSGVLSKTYPETHRAALALAGGLVGDQLAAALQTAGTRPAALLLDDLVKMEREGMFRRAALSTKDMHRRAVQNFLAHNPRKMMLMVSQTCNLRCIYCYAIEGNFEDTGRMMTLETAQAAIKFLAKRSGKRRSITTTLFGGEPLVNFGMIKELVPWAQSWCREIGKRIHFCITTNGTLLTDEAIEFLIRHTFSIMISLDGPKEVQDHNRPNAQGKGSFDLAAPRIKELLRRHPHPDIIKVRATMTHQHHDVRELAKFFADFGFHRIGPGATVGFAFGKGPFDLTSEDRVEMREATEAILDEYALDAIREYREHPYNPLVRTMIAIHDIRDEFGPQVKVPCGNGRNDQGIDVDGKFYPCHRYVGMSAYEFGNVYDGIDLEKLESYYKAVFAAHSHCESCWATRWCSGQCPHYLSHASGKVYSPDNPTCDSMRENLQRNIALYEQLSEEGVDWERLRNEVGE